MLQASVSGITLCMIFRPAGSCFHLVFESFNKWQKADFLHRIKVGFYVFRDLPKVDRLFRDLFLNLFYLLLLSQLLIWKFFFHVIIANLPLCIYNYMSSLPAVWKPQIVTELVLCWKMCTLTTQQLQRTWPAQLQALCKTMVGEGIPSTTLEKTHTYPEQVNENYTTRNRTPSQKVSKFTVALLQHITVP